MTSDQHLACPESTELWAFAAGDLTDSRLEQLAKHVEHCESCGIIIDSLSQHSQSGLVAELRAIQHRPSALESRRKGHRCEVPESLVEAACEAVGSSMMPASFDSGKRLANKLKEGPVRLGRFQLESELGVGAFGYVFKARDTQLDRIVAIKVHRAGMFATDEDAERFIREARSIAQLNHPGIVTVYDTVRSEEDICYLVTEFIDGELLDAQLRRVDFSFEHSANLIASICDALQYAHENGIVHRDVNTILQNAFESRAIQALGLGCRTEISKKSDAVTAAVIEVNIDGRSYHEFGEVDGEPVLRYARAQIMKQSCVHCHNNDAMSPKRDWVEGEVAGVLSITRPLHRDIASTRSGLRSAFNTIAFVATLLMGLTLFVFLGSKSRSLDKIGVSFHGND